MPTWNTIFANSPGASDDASQGDDRIRELKTAIYERLVKELVMNTSSGLAAEDGWLRAGAAKVYLGASAPTTRPDGVTALTSADYGRLWFNTSTLKLFVYTASGWVSFKVADADHADSADSVGTVAPHAIVRLTSGSGNWTVPDGVYRLKVKCIGGGGGGCTSYYGGGGTILELVIPTILSVTPGQLIAYSVGAGGTAGVGGAASGNENGGNGGSTTFGSISAAGGGGGTTTTAGAAPSGDAGEPGWPPTVEYDDYHAAGVIKPGCGGGTGGGRSVSKGGPKNGRVGGGGAGGGGDSTGESGGAGGSGIIIIEY